MPHWNNFPHDDAAFIFKDDSLFDRWAGLHRGDCVPFPDADWVQQCLDEAALAELE